MDEGIGLKVACSVAFEVRVLRACVYRGLRLMWCKVACGKGL